MPKLPKLTAKAAESHLLKNGFELIRTKGSHRIYKRKRERIVIPFHAGKILHPKIIKQVFDISTDE
ncbi:MAG: type II toxin-antitoxin system HicA family toxin [Candidatus Marinimicrobia bacterium]|nr:type II toxin-antitoxin system HicA family toxin [Candidatus Neomarinimicrobiota bacterium]MCH7763893.1 type II toxin-antitoxin system HicA family toxin [Candidatus Neomarinimicrobiota bacterium]